MKEVTIDGGITKEYQQKILAKKYKHSDLTLTERKG